MTIATQPVAKSSGITLIKAQNNVERTTATSVSTGRAMSFSAPPQTAGGKRHKEAMHAC